MGFRGLVILILLVSTLAVIPPGARGVNPSISNVSWSPWVPAHGEYVTVEADISSPGGTPTVITSWCVLPPFTCIPFTMEDKDGDGRFTNSSIRAANPPYTGAHFNVTVVDQGGNSSWTPEIYVQFAAKITVDIAFTPPSAAPGQIVAVAGTALYEDNASVPAKFSAVQLRLEGGPTWSAVTDGAGAFTSSFTAPATEGTYAVNATVTNRTISGSREQYLAVATSPTPDLAVVAGSLSVVPADATAGETVTISASVENRGTSAAGPFSVRINVTGSQGAGLSRDIPVDGLSVGAKREVSATWTASEGTWTVTVIIDPGYVVPELSEENNRAGRAISVAPAPPNGPSATLMVGLVMLGIGVTAAVAFAYRWRAGRRKEP